MTDGNGFDVSVQRLRAAATAYEKEAAVWQQLADSVKGWNLGDDDLGIIGSKSGVVGDYNSAVIDMNFNLGKNATRLKAAADELTAVADSYEQTNEHIEGSFGKLGSFKTAQQH